MKWCAKGIVIKQKRSMFLMTYCAFYIGDVYFASAVTGASSVLSGDFE